MARHSNTKQSIPSPNKAVRRAQVQRELRQLYRVLRTTPIQLDLGRFQDPKREASIVYWDDRRSAHIRLEPFWSMVSSFVHELLHLLDPGDSEARIIVREKLIAHTASPHQLRRLFRHLQRRWLATLAERRARGRGIQPCPLCGQHIAHEVLAAAADAVPATNNRVRRGRKVR